MTAVAPNPRSTYAMMRGLPTPGSVPQAKSSSENGLKSGNSSPLSKSSITAMGSRTTSQSSIPRRPTLPPTPSFPRGDRNKHIPFIRALTVDQPSCVWFGGGGVTVWTANSDETLLVAQRITRDAHKAGKLPSNKPSRYTRPTIQGAMNSTRKSTLPKSHPFNTISQIGSTAHNMESMDVPFPFIRMESSGRLEASGERKYAVHMGDVECWSFMIQVRRARDSPLYDTAFLCDDLSYWDGSQFILVPLTDTRHFRISPSQSNPLFHRVGDSTPSSISTRQSFTHNYNTFPAPQDTASLNSQSTRTIDGSPRVYEKWRHFSTACALYGALGDVGVCDLTSFPFISLYQVKWEVLLSDEGARMEMRSSGVASTKELLELYDKKYLPHSTPVAVLRPIGRKGCMRNPTVAQRCGSRSVLVPKMVIYPFSDAELFQLFYLQLVFRAFFDIRFPSMYISLDDRLTNRNGTPRHVVRADRIGVRCSGDSYLAYEHPTDASRFIVFPSFSSILVLLDLGNAVIPRYASTQEMRETELQPLFGGSPADTPCTTGLGSRLLEWASTVEVSSSVQAFKLLGELFDLVIPKYGVKKDDNSDLGQGLQFFCNEQKGFNNLEFKFGELARFFTKSASPSCSTVSHPLSEEYSTPCGRKETLSHKGVLSCSSSFGKWQPTEAALGPLTVEEKMRMKEVQDGEETAGYTTDGTTVSATDGYKTDEANVMDIIEITKQELQQEASDQVCVSMKRPLELRWQQYIETGNITLFNGTTEDIEITKFLGRGGSGIVYRGLYGENKIPVAVKMFVLVPGMEHSDYVKECLTDLAFYILLNQLSDGGICEAGRAYDFVVSNVVPKGVSEEDIRAACRGGDPNETFLCYFLTDLMDGTLGRFLTEKDDDYDPFYDTIVNSPLHDGEVFQFLYTQLACKAMFDWKIFDLILNQQLRGDNVGYRWLRIPDEQVIFSPRKEYDGILVSFQRSEEAPVEYLKFPSKAENSSSSSSPTSSSAAAQSLRLLYFIDVGQGLQPNVATLRKRLFIGEPMVESCLQDDGFGRYWPLDELYSKHIEVVGEVATEAVRWGAEQKISTSKDASRAMMDLFDIYKPTYGIEAPAEGELDNYVKFSWTSESIKKVKEKFIYRV